MRRIVIGTRGSALALWQANFIRQAIAAAREDLDICLEVIRTRGDEVTQAAAGRMLDKGLFTREIDRALLAGRIDMAVHSLKDLPTERDEGIELAAVTTRQDPADVLIAKEGQRLDELPHGARVLTGSLRRRAQLLHFRGDLDVRPVRGNVDTRLRKLEESDAQGLVLARAGLARLGLVDRVTERLDPEIFLPACGQGALAVEIRSDNDGLRELLDPLEDPRSRLATGAERAFLAALGGGCQVPVGALATVTDGGAGLAISGMVANLDGSRLLRGGLAGRVGDAAAAESLGRQLADNLRADGCGEILEEVVGQLRQAPEGRP